MKTPDSSEYEVSVILMHLDQVKDFDRQDIVDYINSESFQTRVANGLIRGELSHPNRRAQESSKDYLARVFTINEENVCCSFRRIFVESDSVKGALIPSGPWAKCFREIGVKLTFGIRAISSPQNNGSLKLAHIVTFDLISDLERNRDGSFH